ncbi:zeta toxin family protein [Rothia aeria]|jgi:hypothetical protein|uniref:zeta toxin family protein n=1 Tax=Rothia aeria TaxID=172042 RepID=UPI002550E26A|nr:zeta toxin family protein [Rothia aeria]MDK7351990.1 zeta toxin family protein [Rothia aeria]
MVSPQYIIVAGVNGAGKSSLYRVYPHLFYQTRRINADEQLQANNGDWRNPADAAKAMRDTLQDLQRSLADRESIHQETTLAGSAKSFQNLIDKAHAQGYEVTMLYLTIDSADHAIERVADRVKKGGHGVNPEDIRRRYDSSHANLEKLAPRVENLLIFNNTKNFSLVYERIGESVRFDNSDHLGLTLKKPEISPSSKLSLEEQHQHIRYIMDTTFGRFPLQDMSRTSPSNSKDCASEASHFTRRQNPQQQPYRPKRGYGDRRPGMGL